VSGDGVARLPLDLVNDRLELGVGKRLDLAAVVADEMVVVLAACERRLVPRDPGTEVDALDEALLGELLEHAIDACNPDATPLGTHRVWVKLLASDMGNVQKEDRDAHYSLEDVPYVQFFDEAVGLHGTYWHGDFGHPRSHGCVNLSPLDARWMFDFTSPRLPAGWAAAYPTSIEPGTLVRVR